MSSALLHVCSMKPITLNAVLALAQTPVSWGKEELQFDCEREVVHERLCADSVGSTGWRKCDMTFGCDARKRFSVKVDSQSIEVVEHPFFGEPELVTKKLSHSQHLNGLNSFTVEGLSYRSEPFASRLRGFEENGTFPYMLVRSARSAAFPLL